MIYVKIVFLIILTISSFKGLYYLLTIFQQEHYSIKKYMKCFYEYYLLKKYNYFFYLMLLTTFTNNEYIYIFGMSLSFLILLIKNNIIINLKFTKRIVRLLITYILLIIFTLIVSKYKLQTLSIIYLLNPFILILCNFINTPLELLIKHYYIKQASKKISKNKNLIKIAITGSFGKTSIKNIIRRVLEDKYITVATPKSYNTLMGIVKTINKTINNQTELFIVEMGAYRKKEIEKMTCFINPDIGVISDVGYQHMETFKTLENVKTAKFELINKMKPNTHAIINKEALLIDEESLKDKITYYFGNNKSLIYASNIKTKEGITSFSLNYLDKSFVVNTHLLGKHNIKNILATFGVILALRDKSINITDEEFSKKISTIMPIPHRLSYEKQNNIHIYDDAYNSNKNGFINSIDVLKSVPFKKIIITPGIVDLGKMTKEINTEVAKHIRDVFDDIYIIDSYSGIYIYKQLEYLNNVTLVKSFKDAYLSVLSKYKTEEIALLIENDLPDNYLARRRKNEKRFK